MSSGILRAKEKAKAFLELEHQFKRWIESLLSIKLINDLKTELKNGVILSYLLVTLYPNSIPIIHDEPEANAFKYIENIHFFLAAAQEYGVEYRYLFLPQDLLEGKNFPAVLGTVNEIAKIAAKQSSYYSLPELTKEDEEEISKMIDSFDQNKINELAVGYDHVTKEKKSSSYKRISSVVFERQLTLKLAPYQNKEEIYQKLVQGVIRLQAYGRGFLARKFYRNLKRDSAYRFNIAHEFYQTEVDFLNNLCSCIKYYYTPLMLNASKEDHLLNFDQVKTIFIGFNEIAQFSLSLVDTIKPFFDSWSPNSCFGGAIEPLLPELTVYTDFILNFNKSREILASLSKDTTFINFLKNLKDAPEHEKHHDLPSYLIMPIQRIPRYILLLQDLLKHTEENHQDFKKLIHVVEVIKKIALNINSLQKINESLDLLKNLATVVNDLPSSCNLISEKRTIIEEIEIYYLSKKEKINGKLYLFNDSFLLTKELSEKIKRSFFLFFKKQEEKITIHYVHFQEYDKGCFKLKSSTSIEINEEIQIFADPISIEHILEAYNKAEQQFYAQKMVNQAIPPDAQLRTRRLLEKERQRRSSIKRSSYRNSIKIDKRISENLSSLKNVVSCTK